MNPSGDPAPKLTLRKRLRYLFIGPPRDLQDRSLYHHISLIAFLAWVGLGADGLSSSAYGPEEAFKQLGEHGYLAIGLAALMAMTVLVISAGYSRIIEQFPHGGGGYVVATKLLGKRTGVVSGSAPLLYLTAEPSCSRKVSASAAGLSNAVLPNFGTSTRRPAVTVRFAFGRHSSWM